MYTSKNISIFLVMIIIITNVNNSLLANDKYIQIEANKGDGIYTFLGKYMLKRNKQSIEKFKKINKPFNGIKLSGKYNIPIKIYSFNGINIRSTIGITDFNKALYIQHYNEMMFKNGIKSKDFRDDNILWVPIVEADMSDSLRKVELEPIFKDLDIKLFGEKYRKFKEIDHKLEHCVFYLVAGHGGPDPGAIGKKNGKELHEDEYAYDVILRLARKLLEHGAIVYPIVEDPKDGIRDDNYLDVGKNETFYLNQKMNLDYKKRLHQRVDVINELYDNTNKIKNHHVISIHVDSRPTGKKQIDIFFYHAENSENGKNFANTLLETIEEKYRKAQPNRGYSGKVSPRSNLYIIRKTKPVITFIELGNIKNQRDQKRIMIPDNRQAIANWLKDGLLKIYAD